MSADLLRKAAALMRERVQRIEEECGLTPGADVSEVPWFGQTDDYHDVDEAFDPTHAHISTFGHPAVALAVADWLEKVADRGDRNIKPELYVHFWADALAVARAYMGGDA